MKLDRIFPALNPVWRAPALGFEARALQKARITVMNA
jgi:hypothetical protein